MSPRRKTSSVVYWLGDSLYLNVTNHCSNNCYFCFRRFKNGIEGFNLKLQRDPSSIEVIKELQKLINRKTWKEVVFCGFGEPLEKLNCLLKVTRWIKKYHGKVVRVNTNGHGYLLNVERDVVRELKLAGVDKISVSLNAHNEEIYNQVCKPEFPKAFEHVLDFVKKAREEFETEMTTVTIPEAKIDELKRLAKNMQVRFRVRKYIPCFL